MQKSEDEITCMICMADVLIELYKIIEHASHTEDEFLELLFFLPHLFIPEVEFRSQGSTLCRRLCVSHVSPHFYQSSDSVGPGLEDESLILR